MAIRLIAVVLEVADLERSAALYREVFGIDLHASDHDGGDDRWISGAHVAYSWTGGAFLHFALYQAKSDGPTKGAQVGFAVADVEAACARAIAAGASLVHQPQAQPWGRSARFRDYDGNVIELTERP